jgi:hypothetical protein
MATELVREDLGVSSHGFSLGDFSGDTVGSVDEEKIRKCAWIASVLASGDEDEYRRKALAFGIMGYIRATEEDDNDVKEEVYRRYLYIILSRLGNLPAFNNVDSTETEVTFEEQLVASLDSILATELVSTREEYELNPGTVLSKFQDDIYTYLTEGRDVAISAPTSSGKSFILQQFIEQRVEEEERFEAIYVVPTRALISEVSRDLSKLEGVTVRPGIYFNEDEELNP